MESILYPYENILEGPDNYFSPIKNDYTNVLHFIENNAFAQFFFLFLLLYVQRNYFLSYARLVVNKR